MEAASGRRIDRAGHFSRQPDSFRLAGRIDRRHSGQQCAGVNIVVTDRNGFDAPELGIELAAALQKLYPADYKIGRMQRLLVNQAAYDALMAGEDPRRIAQDWMDALQAFAKVREKYLIYK